MKLGIMQPYFFPYIGYFQLINEVDTFVIYDDVQYIKRGWINRNRILQNGKSNMFTFSLQSASSRVNINQRYFTSELEKQCTKFLRTLQFAYGRAPYYESTRAMVQKVFEVMNVDKVDENIALKIGRSLEEISEHLGLNTSFEFSSNIEKDEQKTGQELIIEINSKLGADTYINPINGKELYSHKQFKKENLELFFLKSKKTAYNQFSEEFIPWLSIIDVCMFNDRTERKKLLERYSLSR